MKLAAKLMVVLFLAVMLMTAASAYLAAERAFNRFEQMQAEYARQIVEDLQDDVRQLDRDAIRHALEDRPYRWGGSLIRWVWFEPGAPAESRPIVPLSQLGPVYEGHIVSIAARQANSGARHLHTYYPLSMERDRRGGLEFTASLEALDQQTRDMLVTGLSSIGSLALLCVVVIWLTGIRWIAQPLEQLLAKTRRIGAGDFSGRLTLRGQDELNQLAEALNQMCVQLADQQQRLQSETAERIAALEQLRHADRLNTVGRLAAGIAHEVGTPLNVIAGRAELIRDNRLSDDAIAKSAAAIKSEADRIAHIVRQLLNFARRETPRRASGDMTALVRRTADLLATLANSQGVRIEVESGSPHFAEVDVSQLEQVLTNMVVNGIQAMPDGGVLTIRSSVETRTHRDAPSAAARPFLRIDVVDQGTGISEEDLEHLFEPFFTTKDVGEGTGLGLSIAYGIVQEHGGWIEVRSREGDGSRFTIWLPSQEPLDTPPSTGTP